MQTVSLGNNLHESLFSGKNEKTFLTCQPMKKVLLFCCRCTQGCKIPLACSHLGKTARREQQFIAIPMGRDFFCRWYIKLLVRPSSFVSMYSISGWLAFQMLTHTNSSTERINSYKGYSNVWSEYDFYFIE